MPHVAVIIPAFNAQKYICDAIKSVRDQTWSDWTLLVVNDGSTDNTKAIVESFSRTDSRISVITRANGKLAKARNTGIDAATGDFIAFLDADDLWEPSKLRKQIDAYRSSSAGLIFSDARLFGNPNGKAVEPRFALEFQTLPAARMFRTLYNGNVIPVSSVLIARRSVDDLRFDEHPKVRGVEDYELWMRLASRGVDFFGIEEKLVNYRCHAQQMSRNLVSMMSNTIAVRQKYRKLASDMGIDVERQHRIDCSELAYITANAGAQKLAWVMISQLCNVRLSGVGGIFTAIRPALHAFFHLVRHLIGSSSKKAGNG